MYLTYPQRELTVGNLLGDMIRNNLLDDLTYLHREGVAIHRFIDSYTDGHKSLDEARAALRVRHRKYAPVVLDILMDFVLVEEWSEYSTMPFEHFQDWVYSTIDHQAPRVPQSAAIRMQHMANARWLGSYANRQDFQSVLERMDRRARFASKFGEALHDLDEHRDLLRRSLSELMKDIRLEVELRMKIAILRSEEKS